MFYGLLLICQTANPTQCQFMNSVTPFETEEACMVSAAEQFGLVPPEVYIAGVSCMEVRFLEPDA